jgi:hypothetical protein
MAGERPVFQLLELAEIPDRKSGSGRGMLCIIVAIIRYRKPPAMPGRLDKAMPCPA